jgi:hypothetical protein
VTGGWSGAAGAAAIGFLSLLVLATVLVVALALDAPEIGAPSNPFDVLTLIVLVALGILGAPVRLGGLEIGMLPMGVLLIAGVVLVRSASSYVAGRPERGLTGRALEGAKVGVVFSLLCLVAAASFQLRDPIAPVSVGSGGALAVGLFWGVLFGALGGLRTRASLGVLTGIGLGVVRQRRLSVYEGLQAGGIMVGSTALLALFALLLMIIVGLARGEPVDSPTAGDALAGLIYLLAILPNILVLIASFATGAPVEIGAGIGSGADFVGTFASYSLLGFGEAVGPLLLMLVLVPLVSSMLGGFSARRNAFDPRSKRTVLVIAALTYALTLGVLAWLGAFRVGVGVSGEGFARFAPAPVATFFYALLWSGMFGFAGWKLGESRKPAPEPSEREIV